MSALPNRRQEAFCQAWVKARDGKRNQAQIYQDVGYVCKNNGTASAAANGLLKNLKIKKRINELEKLAFEKERRLQAKVEEAAVIDRTWVVNRLVQNVDRASQAEPVTDKEGNPTGVYRYEGGVVNRGLELIGKDLGMFAEKSPFDGMLNGAQVLVQVYLPEKAGRRELSGDNGHANGHSSAPIAHH